MDIRENKILFCFTATIVMSAAFHLVFSPRDKGDFSWWLAKANNTNNRNKEILYCTNALQNWKLSDGNAKKIAALSKRAMAYSLENEYAKAFVDTNEKIKLDPASWTYSNRAHFNMTKGNYFQALQDCGQALLLSATNFAALEFQNDIYKETGVGGDKLLLNLDKAVKMAPENNWIRVLRGKVYFSNGKYAEALKDFNALIEKSSVTVYIEEAYYLRGQVHYIKGEYDDAIKDFQKVNNLLEAEKSDYTYNYYNRNKDSHIDTKMETVEAYDKYINMFPDVAYHDLRRGRFYYLRDDYVRAMKDYDAALTMMRISEPNYAYVRYARGLCYLNRGFYDKALDEFNHAAKEAKYRDNAALSSGFIYYLQNRLGRAVGEFNKALSMAPDADIASGCYYWKLLALKEMKNAAEAEKTRRLYEKYLLEQIQKEPFEQTNYANLSELYCESVLRGKEALKEALNAAAIKRDYVSYYTLGRAFLANESPQKAVENFKKSLKLKPRNIWCLYRLGKIYKEYLHDERQAGKYFKKVFDINPKFRFILELYDK